MGGFCKVGRGRCEGERVHRGRRRGGGFLSREGRRKTAWVEKLGPVENCLRFASMSKADLSCYQKWEENFLHRTNHCWDLIQKKTIVSAASFFFQFLLL